MSQRLHFEQAEHKGQYVSPAPTEQSDTTRRNPVAPTILREEETVRRTDGYSTGASSQRKWWQEEINGVRGVPKTAAVGLGLLYILSAFATPLVTFLANTILRLSYAVGSVSLDMGFSIMSWIAVVAGILSACGVGYALARIAPRNAVPGAAVAGAVHLLLVVFSLLSYGMMLPSNPTSASLLPNLVPFVVRPLIDLFVLILTTVVLARHSRYKRSRER